MSLRDSLDLIRMVRPEAGTAALDNEIAAERASSLWAAEQRVLKAIAALEAATGDREMPLVQARKVVWEYFVQRELVGFRRHADVIADLRIPPEVLLGLGAMPIKPR
ncbi:MAG: hypothetical protein P0Y65_04900 [Candidatus Devosia phytovorans]|uniref:Uncharacterized protein n=1 Tax=Candidatus Devosia phytovorans TaxID=3121372 RepID=A0AAJ5VY46_9HYPH|nr:DUF6665 family protein [Devosia sp.]WEK05597.1 MAG: hypothetical protein P0Y65_04900 [Devosia sp.]